MKYCSSCGSDQIEFNIPKEDNLPRYCCHHCGMIHYQNPNIVAGCLLTFKGQILLCRRAIEPRYGCWTIPAGFMENHETLEQAAKRETWEEAKAVVNELMLYAIVSIPAISQVYVLFKAELAQAIYAAGSESLEVQLFEPKAIPWDELAFPVIIRCLDYYLKDRATGKFQTHIDTIYPSSQTVIHH